MARKDPKYFFGPLFIKLRQDLANLAPFRIQYESSLAIRIKVYCEKGVSLKGQLCEMIFWPIQSLLELREFFFSFGPPFTEIGQDLDLWMRSSRVVRASDSQC
jgi:hypothetical protein